jgi:hypothetical protein
VELALKIDEFPQRKEEKSKRRNISTKEINQMISHSQLSENRVRIESLKGETFSHHHPHISLTYFFYFANIEMIFSLSIRVSLESDANLRNGDLIYYQSILNFVLISV